MNARVTFATAARVLHQLRNDRRTLALLWGVPILLQALVKFVFWDQDPIFQRLGPPLLGVFPMTSMFLVTSVAMLRERTSGTLERLLTMPMAKLDLLVGYAIAFGLLAAIQATLAAAVAFGLLGLETGGPAWDVVLLAVLNAVLGMAMGLLLSAFASTEFQRDVDARRTGMPQCVVKSLFEYEIHLPSHERTQSKVVLWIRQFEPYLDLARTLRLECERTNPPHQIG